MVKVLLRLIQDIAPDKWQQLETIDKKFNEMESKMSFPLAKIHGSLPRKTTLKSQKFYLLVFLLIAP